MSQQFKRKEETLGKEMTADEVIAYTLKDLQFKKVFTTFSLPDSLKEYLKAYEIEAEYASNAKEAALLADVYARDTNGPSVLLLIPGSQVLETIGIIAQAFMDSLPLFIISSLRSFKDTGRARIGELKSPVDIINTLKPIVKSYEQITDIENSYFILLKAYKDLLSNRPRPVYIEIAEDLFRLKAYPLTPSEQKPERRTPDKNTTAKVAEVLSNAKMPVIVAGYGVIISNGWDDLRQLAEYLDIPVISTIRAKGVIPSNHPLYAGEGLGLFATRATSNLLSSADAILAIGTRFTQLSTAGWSAKFTGILMHNSVDGEDIGKAFMAVQPIIGDSGLFLKDLISIIKTKIKEPVKRNAEEFIKKYNEKEINIEKHEGIWPIDVVNEVNKLEYNKVYIDISSTTFDFIRLPIYRPLSWITSETIIEKGIGVSGIALSENERNLGITDVHGILNSLSLIAQRLDKAKGILIIMNDDGLTYLDSTKSDIPGIGRAFEKINIDPLLEKTLNAKTITSKDQLTEELTKPVNGIKVLNVKIDASFKSVVLQRV